MYHLSPVGLSTTTLTANQLSVQATFIERLCQPFCVNSTVQPQVTVNYKHGNGFLNGTTLFVPIQATITVVTQGCGCQAKTQLFTENFVVSFQGQTALPTAIQIASQGIFQYGSNVRCGKARDYTINESLTVTITPPAA